MLTLDRARPAWFDVAVCVESTPEQLEDFFPERWASDAAARARARCAACPALIACLQHAVAVGEPDGIYGGTSTRRRRPLRAIWEHRDHDYDPTCAAPTCTWCRAVDQVVCEVDAKRQRDEHGRFALGTRVVLNGPRARCGYRSTYGRGCRCPACTFAVSALGRRLTAAGYDTGGWWASWAGAGTGEKARMLAMAKRIALADLAVAA